MYLEEGKEDGVDRVREEICTLAGLPRLAVDKIFISGIQVA
jgi:hypothetical protein